MATATTTAQGSDPRPGRRDLILLGGGEHARVVTDAVRSVNGAWQLIGFVDEEAAGHPHELDGLPRLGDDDWLSESINVGQAGEGWWLVGAVGDGQARRRLAQRFGTARWATIVHAAAWVSPSATLRPGAVVLAGAVVNAGAFCGEHAIVNSGAVVEHDVVVGAFSHVAPGAVIGGGTAVGEGAFIGLGARVRDHVSVGPHAVVGMGAVVVADVPAFATVIGVPARLVVRAHGGGSAQ